MEKVDLCHDGHELFRIRKQRVGEKEDVVGVGKQSWDEEHRKKYCEAKKMLRE